MENAPASRDYSGGFMAQLMAKDLGLAQEAAQASASSTPMGSLALSLYRLLLKQGYAERTFPWCRNCSIRPKANRQAGGSAPRLVDSTMRGPP